MFGFEFDVNEMLCGSNGLESCEKMIAPDGIEFDGKIGGCPVDECNFVVVNGIDFTNKSI